AHVSMIRVYPSHATHKRPGTVRISAQLVRAAVLSVVARMVPAWKPTYPQQCAGIARTTGIFRSPNPPHLPPVSTVEHSTMSQHLHNRSRTAKPHFNENSTGWDSLSWYFRASRQDIGTQS